MFSANVGVKPQTDGPPFGGETGHGAHARSDQGSSADQTTRPASRYTSSQTGPAADSGAAGDANSTATSAMRMPLHWALLIASASRGNRGSKIGPGRRINRVTAGVLPTKQTFEIPFGVREAERCLTISGPRHPTDQRSTTMVFKSPSPDVAVPDSLLGPFVLQHASRLASARLWSTARADERSRTPNSKARSKRSRAVSRRAASAKATCSR